MSACDQDIRGVVSLATDRPLHRHSSQRRLRTASARGRAVRLVFDIADEAGSVAADRGATGDQQRHAARAGEAGAPGASPSACRAVGGRPRPSANDSKVNVAHGFRWRVAYSLSRPWLMPVNPAICPGATPGDLSTVITMPRSRLTNAS